MAVHLLDAVIVSRVLRRIQVSIQLDASTIQNGLRHVEAEAGVTTILGDRRATV